MHTTEPTRLAPTTAIIQGTASSPGEDAGAEFDSGYMGPHSTFSFTFEQGGEYEYFCELHPNMIGTVVVD
jgi:plastocyanin